MYTTEKYYKTTMHKHLTALNITKQPLHHTHSHSLTLTHTHTHAPERASIWPNFTQVTLHSCPMSLYVQSTVSEPRLERPIFHTRTSVSVEPVSSHDGPVVVEVCGNTVMC